MIRPMKFLSSVLFSVLVFAQTASAGPVRTQVKFDADVEPSLRQQMLGDLDFIAQVKGARTTPLHQQVFGKLEGANYSKWFDTRIFSIGKNACGGGNAVACVIPMFDNNKMWVTKNYTQFSHPQVSRVSVIFHEARHSERQNGNWSHATCPTPFKDAAGNDVRSIWTGAMLQGQAACDVTPFGSYGSATILLKNIALNCENCNSKVRADADLYANDQLGRVIDPKAKAAMRADFGMTRKR
jgi:hypothetical protein